MAPKQTVNYNNKYPEYVVTIGPENQTLIFAPSSNWASCKREPYMVCKNGWVELADIR